MSRIAKSEVQAAFEWAAHQITEAGGRDGITSRAEIRRKIAELTGAERDLVDFFYRFIVRQDNNPSERVTRTDIDRALTSAAAIVAAVDKDRNGLSADEIANLPPLARLAVKVARQRQRSGEDLSNHYESLAFSLVFDDYGTELTNERFLSFHVPGQIESLTPGAFREALKLDQDDPRTRISRNEPADEFFHRLIDHHTPGQTAQAVALAQAMQSTLADVRVYFIGDDPAGGPMHDVYIAGLAPDGSIAGLRSRVRWS